MDKQKYVKRFDTSSYALKVTFFSEQKTISAVLLWGVIVNIGLKWGEIWVNSRGERRVPLVNGAGCAIVLLDSYPAPSLSVFMSNNTDALCTLC